ncbi:MAG TPA: bifunctional DNA-formamidopyrimidine glycosylase/DNA-(apurinic or apyrimidinic site) lyase [Magnetospirillaceae bacterium]|nr:bifunctional DNA-formamidopyrimidine glycosylase/DNA-(apurinic or apyrimidinic site) lyase [Magnetospirillaceae bacterium]
MPELPEVETVRLGLEQAMAGRLLLRVMQRRPDLRRPFPPLFERRLTGRRIDSLSRRAKYLVLHLDDGAAVLVHLGMSGRMLVGRQSNDPFGTHDHVVFDLDDGGRVVFNDARRFGLMDLTETALLAAHPLLRDIGPEPLGEHFTPKLLASRIAGKSSAIKIVLLDQTVVAGIGNIYASEALYRAGIDPMRAASSLKPAEIAKLVPAIQSVLLEAIAAGGSSLRDHRRPDGELGYFQHGFKVYDREGEPCPDCTCREGIQRIVQGGRSTFYCAKKQR